MRTYLHSAVAALVAVALPLFCWADHQTCNPPDDPQVVAAAAALRELGPRGLEQALAEFDRIADLLARTAMDIDVRQQTEGELADWQRVAELVAQQRSAHVSRLYWHTELEEALAESRDTGKPVLSLRMLGKLTDEYSCANSRFFRTTLYVNESIRQKLAEKFVLHWQSVRPVPVVTIDFGDGRKLERTLTGNSAHYVLASDGTPLDALPGLYSPAAFSAWLDRTVSLYDRLKGKNPPEYVIAEYHRAQLAAIDRQLARDVERLPEELRASFASATVQPVNRTEPRPVAAKASRIAVGKTAAEGPLVRAIEPATRTIELVSQSDNEPLWRAIAALHEEGSRLDKASVELIRSEQPIPAHIAARAAMSKAFVEDPLVRLVSQFENSIALDTVRNEYLLHRKIHKWYVEGSATTSVDNLNKRVYAELFLTPSSDPWLGLVPPDTYTGLREGGLRVEEASATVAR
jgi:hypothetical protein